jgi:lysophospholipase L1-like esterase
MHWYEEDIKQLEKRALPQGYVPETIFYGSSSIRVWASLYDDLKELKPLNLGFGGSTLEACVWFFDRVMMPYHPKRLIVYAGDNDLGDGRNPEQVLTYFKQLAALVQQRFGDIPCYFISLKPSIARYLIIDKFKYANSLIENEILKTQNNWQFIDVFKYMVDEMGHPKKEYYQADGLHLTPAGYELWKEVIEGYITVNH